MAITSIETLFLDGRVKFPIVHKPQPKWESTDLEYSVKVECTEEQLKKLKAKGVSGKKEIKIDENDGRTYMRLNLDAVTADGKANTVSVVDSEDKPITALIGNGSKARVAASLIHFDSGKAILVLRSSKYGYALKVTELVEYVAEPKQVDTLDPNDGEII